ncbi:MAG TPA: DsbA family protein [Fimbriimonadaceae bacterium]|nr:DsbA family protein [Fimbriimonadaceae bacterium]
MSLTIPVAHDFVCPWCWIGLFQAKRLQEELGVKIEWLSYELFPEELDFPVSAAAATEVKSNRPKTPSRMALAYAASGMAAPPSIERPKNMRTHNAHEAVEYAKEHGGADELLERLYRAYWEEGQEIDDPQVIANLAAGVVSDVQAMLQAVQERRYKDRIVGFDDDAYAAGVYNVPTFFIDGERYAEQPYEVLRQAVAKAHSLTSDEKVEAEGKRAAERIYTDLTFPDAPSDRPYCFINMVCTIDGKTVTGARDEPVHDLGSRLDHELMRRIEEAADAIMLGAGSLRATPKLWYPKDKIRIVVTRSGDLPYQSRFFTDAPEKAYICGPEQVRFPEPTQRLQEDLAECLRTLRDMGVQRLLVEGGSELNAELLRRDLVDELFLTLAPKIKLGRDIATYAGGEPLGRGEVQRYELIESHRVGDEMFLRYRRKLSGG